MSIVKDIIEDEINKLNTDYLEIEKELNSLEDLHKQSLDKKIYKSSLALDIFISKMLTLNSILSSIKQEIELYEIAFTVDIINDLDYILKEYKIFSPKAYASLIVEARIDIKRFENSKISTSDYNRDKKAILNKVDKLNQFFFTEPHIKFAKPQYQVLQPLIFFLQSDKKILIDEELSKKISLSDEAVKAIVDTISTLKKIPRGQDNFDIEFVEYIYGDSLKKIK